MDERYTPSEASINASTNSVSTARRRAKFPWLYVVSRVILVAVVVNILYMTAILSSDWDSFRYLDGDGFPLSLALAIVTQLLRLSGAVLLVRRKTLAPLFFAVVLLITIGDVLSQPGVPLESFTVYGFAMDTFFLLVGLWMLRTSRTALRA